MCKEITGDSDDTEDLDAADIVCITPEKFDSLTRKHSDNGGMRFFAEVRTPRELIFQNDRTVEMCDIIRQGV